MSHNTYPIANTPKIIKQKKKKCIKIWITWAIISAFFVLLFLLSIRIDSINSFVFSICCISMPFVSFFAAAFWYIHVKFFPEFDYGPLSAEEIRQLPISEKYYRERKKIRKSKLIKSAIMLILICLTLFLQCYFRDLTLESKTWENILWIIELIFTCCIVAMIKLLQWDVRERRELEIKKYDIV